MKVANKFHDKQHRVDVFLGHEIEEPTELRFLRRLCADLEAIGDPVLILGNFYCGPLRTQIDFVVVTSRGATVVEVKGFRLPVAGGVNGQWTSLLPSGERRTISSKNPFQQGLDARHAVTDALSRATAVDSSRAKQAVGGNLCLFPEPLAGSSIPTSNFKCMVGGYRQLLSQIKESRAGAVPLEIWREFASSIGLVQCTEGNPGAGELLSAEYRVQWQTTIAATSRPFVPLALMVDGQETSLDECVQRLSEGDNLLIVGASGSGKSRILEVLSTRAASAGMLPMMVEARVFVGSLGPLLERSIALTTRYSLADVLQGARRSGNSAVVLVDGFNECPAIHQNALTRALFALYRRHGMQVVVTSQSEMPIPWLPCHAAIVPEPTKSHRRAVLESHLGRAAEPAEQDALEVAATAHDAEILTSVIGRHEYLDSRFSLYSAFTRHRLGSLAAVAHPALAKVAERMRETFLSSLSEHEVLRELTSILDSGLVAAQVWDMARHSGLMVFRSSRAFFRHDLIADYFSTVSLLTHCQEVDATARALARPIYGPLVEFAVGACETLADLGRLLHGASPELLIACIDGKCGAKARSLVLDQVRDMLDVVVSDYRQLILELETDEAGRHHINARLPDGVETRSYGNYMAVVPHALSHGLLPDVMRAFRTVDRFIWDEAERLRARYPDIKVAFRRRAYNAIYGSPGSINVCAMHEIQQGFGLLGCRSGSTALSAALWEKLSTPMQLYPGQLLIVAGAANRVAPLPNHVPRNFATVVQELWDLGIQRLRLEVVDLVRRIGPHLDAEQEQELRNKLDSWLSDNDIFTNALVFDALQGIGGPETDLSVESAYDEFLAALRMTPSALASERAMHLYVCTFDHPCDALYYEAFYERLTDTERQEVLVRAAGATYADLTTSMVIAELARNPARAAVPCFQKFAQTPDLSGTWTQSAVETYLRSIAALADMRVDLVSVDEDTSGTSTWHYAARLLHFLARHPEEAAGARQAALWAQLESCGVAHAFDVVMRVETCTLFDGKDSRVSFLPSCGDGMRRLARAALGPGYRPETEFRQLARWRDLMTEHRVFALQVLGHVGRKTDLELVRLWTEDANLGKHAIAAARALELPRQDVDSDDARKARGDI
ncbi:nuclease-related domain-containing protein [Burkholderia pseudomallei]|uniref:nuclease-related domain-containing protein n=1 Tax=Burkholderia pseudomallei TaxID=28450 RepID=UPI000975381B|nr:nuclease-related domain-containing protein [Burkholderia pseudomallei]CAJ2784238.1 Nuclease-related domain [Burkholderia pseudomallei]CAJ2818598.1 Nuclease-related domain [Burkholderia pseudomallei]CAJ2950675.1 Nuclease-related domain [Burkholderia pseudomallei]CAJ6550250.1 Nuclease-related domain [Burkholderia pseudomallei]CAJ7219301.1 Nuclease-related domain [Burkholderia pseudomallei]